MSQQVAPAAARTAVPAGGAVPLTRRPVDCQFSTESRGRRHEGKPQKYGTQFVTSDGKRSLWNIDPSVGDDERDRWSVPSLAEAIAGDAKTTEALRLGDAVP